jgi:hypothetical protein
MDNACCSASGARIGENTICSKNIVARNFCADVGTIRDLSANAISTDGIFALNGDTIVFGGDVDFDGDVTINGTLTTCIGSTIGTVLVGNGADDMVCFDPLDNPGGPAVPGEVLTYTGLEPFGVLWAPAGAGGGVCTGLNEVTVGTGAGTTCLAPTSANECLCFDGTTVGWFYSGLAERFQVNTTGAGAVSVDISPIAGTTTTVVWGTEALNTAPLVFTGFAGVGPNTTLTITLAGDYIMHVTLVYTRAAGSTSSTSSLLRIQQNGVDVEPGYITAGVPAASSSGSASFSTIVTAAAGDIFEIVGSRGNSGGGAGQPLMTGLGFNFPALPAIGPCSWTVERVG